jgi:hypothetical protein
MTTLLAREKWMIKTIAILERVFEERVRQVAQYGHNDDLEDGTGPDVQWLKGTDINLDLRTATEIEQAFRHEYENHEERNGKPTWMHLVREEIGESFAESDPERLEAELIQVAALAVSWIESLEKRS